ncbi:hypothetical protein BESB_079630 [Besnoitia besnoiti]|uniref:Conserved oligomeric Golgi complex subunit 6 n=1 Tax=Besnoitia besnoiti TaxID=94643 RepID=A0A2A9MDP5_BESBE|nr:hypothetical protein BESB_079630 [Besnoitia besnoiti]PFH33747.1 hypothetical protein BESB_079630 [Besnoitia besnoiti]
MMEGPGVLPASGSTPDLPLGVDGGSSPPHAHPSSAPPDASTDSLPPPGPSQLVMPRQDGESPSAAASPGGTGSPGESGRGAKHLGAAASVAHPLARKVARILSRPFGEAAFLPDALTCLSSFYLPPSLASREGNSDGASTPVVPDGDGRRGIAAQVALSQTADAAGPPPLAPLLYGERLRIHRECLAAFAPIRSQIREMTAHVQTLSTTCAHASSQLRRSRSQLATLFHEVEALRGQQQTLQRRQRLCQLLLDGLQLHAPLLEALTGHIGGSAGAGGGELPGAVRAQREAIEKQGAVSGGQGRPMQGGEAGEATHENQLDGRFFLALKELEKVRKRALRLQARMTQQLAPIERDFADTALDASASSGPDRLDAMSSVLARPHSGLAEDVLQQTADLREAAYERLYLWMQDTFRRASGHGGAGSSDFARRSEENGGRGRTGTGKTAEASAFSHVEAFSHTLAAVGLVEKWERERRETPGHEGKLRKLFCLAEEETPLLLRGFRVLAERPAYLEHSVREFCRLQSLLNADILRHASRDSEGHRTSHASGRAGPAGAVLESARKLAENWRKMGLLEGQRGTPEHQTRASGAPETKDRSAAYVLTLGTCFDSVSCIESVKVLRAALQHAAYALAAERAVIRGLRGLLPPDDETSPSAGVPRGLTAPGEPSSRGKDPREVDATHADAARAQADLVSNTRHQALGLSAAEGGASPEREAGEEAWEVGLDEGRRERPGLGSQDPGESGASPHGSTRGPRGGHAGSREPLTGGLADESSFGDIAICLLEESTEGLYRPLRAAIDQAFSMMRASTASAGVTGGSRMQRQQQVLGVLLMVRLLDAYACLFRALLLFQEPVSGLHNTSPSHPKRPDGEAPSHAESRLSTDAAPPGDMGSKEEERGTAAVTGGGVFLELTARLQEALEILHAPVVSEEEETELWLLASGVAGAAAARRAPCTGAGAVPSSWVNERAVLDLLRGRKAAVWGPEVRLLTQRFRLGRRSRITGKRAYEALGADGDPSDDESEELHAWVEASVAPLLNFCRQEAPRFGDPGEAAVCLINAYACVQEPLRRFRVCGSYLRLLSELVEQQMVTLVQGETAKVLAALGLADRLEALRRAAGREQSRESDEQGRGGTLTSAGEVLLRKEELGKFFREFYVTLYGVNALHLQYVDRLMHRHLRSNARKLVLSSVLQAYSEVYVHTSHLGVASHTPEDISLLLGV